MKPLKLVMSGFGPYKDKKIVDFSVFDNSGIFLITGDTGAGKTTIFDGISFALFGEASGSNRDSSTFRSKFSNNDIETFVELTFIHKNVEYKIIRNPSYLVPKKRGVGETVRPSDATLFYKDEVITGLKTVNEKIIEILGINAKQFKQISMLAQGEFIKILHADSDERKMIFRKIFNTDIFDLITLKLNEVYKENKEVIEILKTEFVTNSNNIILKDDNILLDKNSLTKEEINRIIEFLKELIYKNDLEIKEIDNLLVIEEKKNKDLENIIKSIEDNNKKILEYNYLIEEDKKLRLKDNEIKDIKLLLEKNNKVLKEIRPIEIKIEGLENDIKNEDIKINNKISLINKSCEIVENIKEKEENIKLLKPILDNYEKLSRELKDKEEVLKNCEDVLNLYNEKQIIDRKYLCIQKEYVDLDLSYKMNEDKYFRNQAGILAGMLKEGEVCPVCGSKDHPILATLEEDVLSLDELDLEWKKVELKQKSLNDIKEKISSYVSKIDLFNKKIECNNVEEVQVLKSSININEYKDKINILINDFEKICKSISNIACDIDNFDLVEFINDFNKENNKVKEELETNKKMLEEYKNNKVLYEESLKNEFNLFNNLIISLGFLDKGDYYNRILSDDKIKELEGLVKRYESDLIIVTTKIGELEKNLVNKEIVDLNEKYSELNKLTDNINLLKKNRQDLYSTYDNNLKISKRLEKTSASLISYMDKYSLYEDLYKLSSGNISGKKRISFEQYVQATYFDMVLQEANIRLQSMSDGRFRLLRKEVADSLSAKFALDLDVYDEYNGNRRDVRSLSGGESFKAALALALGLSDVIQNYSGGISIDTLFIDEGFGSLDGESLEQAINTLFLLSNNNKLIGIISHVSSLKDRIDRKIIITKGKEGSEINVEI